MPTVPRRGRGRGATTDRGLLAAGPAGHRGSGSARSCSPRTGGRAARPPAVPRPRAPAAPRGRGAHRPRRRRPPGGW
ncbi:MAG: hypothetical protein EA398_11260 [Deltaproteobacteria bacterium]|nr:MAG: hypothetical protein EA398_11260 [Deltaproteobacteria bacterium]